MQNYRLNLHPSVGQISNQILCRPFSKCFIIQLRRTKGIIELFLTSKIIRGIQKIFEKMV